MKKLPYEAWRHEGVNLKHTGAWYALKLVTENRRDEYLAIRGATPEGFDQLRAKLGAVA